MYQTAEHVTRMASLSLGRGISTITSMRFYKMVALILVGAVVTTLATNWLQNNVLDVDIPMQDAVYALVAIVAVRSVMSGSASMLVAAGAGTGLVVAALDEIGVVG